MALVFAALSPHPPVLIPEIGGPQTEQVKKTIKALNTLSQNFLQSQPNTLIIISPHGLVYPDRMNVCGMKILQGDFSAFGTRSYVFSFENDQELAFEIDQKANQDGIKTLLYDNGAPYYILDHGTLVPLYFLCQHLKYKPKLVPVVYSFQDKQSHFCFGQVIQKIIKKTEKRVAVVASGDLSHYLSVSPSQEQWQAGQEFDQKIQEYLKKQNIKAILDFDEEFLEEAGECGYRSILILLGILSGLKWKTEILSYECPFGVGYLVAQFHLGTKR